MKATLSSCGSRKLVETVLLVGAALLLNLIVYELMESKSLFFLFMLAIATTSVLAGWRYGLLALLMSTLAVLFFFVEPRFTLQTSHASEWQRLGLFALSGLVAVLIAWRSGRSSGNHRLQLL
jgi:K+-sensing histidine kinase KdpD